MKVVVGLNSHNVTNLYLDFISCYVILYHDSIDHHEMVTIMLIDGWRVFNHFREKAPSQMFVWVFHTSLTPLVSLLLTLSRSHTFVRCFHF